MKAFFVWIHPGGFRPGKPAEIIGVSFVTPSGKEARACYQVRFEDGKEDFCPISESDKFAIISEDDVRSGKIPVVK